jgi:hypothetical protein
MHFLAVVGGAGHAGLNPDIILRRSTVDTQNAYEYTQPTILAGTLQIMPVAVVTEPRLPA